MKAMWICAVLAWSILATLMVVPYGTFLLNDGCLAIPILALLTAGAVYHFRHTVLAVITAVGCLAAFILVTAASFRNDIVRPRLQGVVYEVGRSTNHQYPVVQIKNDDGSTIRLEGVSETFLKAVKINDKIEKVAGASSAAINGKSVALLDASLVDLVRISHN